MRYLEIRRHAFTKKGADRGRGSHLSQEGVAAARRVGAQIGPFAPLVSSDAHRTLETAIAMGFAVNDVTPFGAGYLGVVEHHDQWSWPSPYLRYRVLLATDATLAAAAAQELGLWRSVVAQVPDGESGLIVSHGGAIEPTLGPALPECDHEAWGQPFADLDGSASPLMASVGAPSSFGGLPLRRQA